MSESLSDRDMEIVRLVAREVATQVYEMERAKSDKVMEDRINSHALACIVTHGRPITHKTLVSIVSATAVGVAIILKYAPELFPVAMKAIK